MRELRATSSGVSDAYVRRHAAGAAGQGIKNPGAIHASGIDITMWAEKESNLHFVMRNYRVSISLFQYIHSVEPPPSPHKAHLTKSLPRFIIIFEDLMKLNKLTHPSTNW